MEHENNMSGKYAVWKSRAIWAKVQKYIFGFSKKTNDNLSFTQQPLLEFKSMDVLCVEHNFKGIVHQKMKNYFTK